MDAKNIQVGKFFTTYGVFKVPVYQRGYAWESDQIDDFVEDIKRLLEDDMSSARHFFGGVVTVRQSDLTMPGGVYYEVVDGQQRLTTFSLALSSVAHALDGLRTEAAAQGQDGQVALQRIDAAISVLNGTLVAPPPPVIELGEDSGTPNPPIPRLTLSDVDESCFRVLVEGGDCQSGAIYSRQLLVRARRSLATRLTQDITGNDGLSLIGKVEELLRLATAILNRAEVVHIVGDDSDEGNHLFMVLNTRGKALSAAELIRTHTLRLLQAYGEEQRRAEIAWRGPINRTPTETNNFLRNYYASKKGIRVSEQKLFEKYVADMFPSSIKDHAHAVEVADSLEELAAEAVSHQKIAAGNWPFDPTDVSEWDRKHLLALIKLLKYRASIPLLLSLRAANDEKLFAEAVNVIERFAFRFTVSGGHPSEGADALIEEALLARKGDYAVDTLVGTTNRLLRRYARERAFASAVSEMRYTSGDNATIKYFLSMLESFYPYLKAGEADVPLRPEKMVVFDYNVSSIEHIYPKVSKPEDMDAQLEPLEHNLGNLTFWGSQNAPSGNVSFAEKKANEKTGYPNAPTALVRELAQLNDWNAETLQERQDRLVDWGLRVFRIPGEKEDVEHPPSTWLVRYDPESEFSDRRSQLVDFPYNAAYGRAIDHGDVLVLYLLAQEAPADKRIVAIARVGAILTPPERDFMLLAFSGFKQLDPACGFADIGGDPRANQTDRISSVPDSVLGHVMNLAGLKTVNDLPPVPLDEEELRRELLKAASDELGGNEEE